MIRKAILVIGFLATAALIATGVHGYQLVLSREALEVHLALAFSATLLLVLGHGWVVIYLLVLDRGVRRIVGRQELAPALAETPRQLRRSVFPWLIAAVVLALGTFFVGSGTLVGDLPGWLHATLFFAAILAQAGAMVKVHRGLLAADALLAEIHRQGAPPPEPAGAAMRAA